MSKFHFRHLLSIEVKTSHDELSVLDKMNKLKKTVFNEWFDISLMAILLMWLTPWGSFDIERVGFYISILVSIFTIKNMRHFLKKYQKKTT